MEATTTIVAAPAAFLGWEKQWRGTRIKKASQRPRHVDLSQQTILLSSALRYCRQQLEILKMDARDVARSSKSSRPYSVAHGSRVALDSLLNLCRTEVPGDFFPLARNVKITSRLGNGDQVHFPSPLKEQDVTAAIKALEACAAGAIANLRYGTGKRGITVDLDKVSGFLMSAYLTNLDGMDKANVKVKERIPDTDLNQAQSVLYRRLSANLYSTQIPTEYYHIHGSLDASTTLEMLGLPKENPDLTDYRECINTIEKAVMKHTAAELDVLNTKHRQAGIQAYTWEQFQSLPHGKALTQLPPFTVTRNIMDPSTPPVPFDHLTPNHSGPQQALKGIKVIELCRIIAGPTIGRSLAAHGAQVIKVTSPNLPDVPFFQLDVNTGKQAIHLDLRDPLDRAQFDNLLADADVLIDGYRPGALARLGYGPDSLASLAVKRKKGFVYVAEDCFGGTGSGLEGAKEWQSRPGWQQIADCVTGVAWAQGKFMGLNEPVVPPFPMSDYGTGALGCLAALSGLYKRATEGGSWVCRTSLCQYDVFLLGLGLLPDGEQTRLRKLFGYEEGSDGGEGFFGLRHSDSVDEVGRRALKKMREVTPFLFESEKMMHEGWSEGFGGIVRWPKEAIEVEGLRVGQVRCARPNGWDNSEEKKKSLERRGMLRTKNGGGWEEGWEEDVIR